ncbi:hypothetical protein GYMLUDRAFT_79602 [Collybiopsis luxurians FD-317 M1]|nr:hypothetical protein GYMLUDRAFT_79602 [Collybiopsis luxurians FD-317 M1]
MTLAGIALFVLATASVFLGVFDARNMLDLVVHAQANQGRMDQDLDLGLWREMICLRTFDWGHDIGEHCIHRCFVIRGYDSRIVVIPTVAAVLNTFLAIAATVLAAHSNTLDTSVTDLMQSLGKSKTAVLYANLAVNWCLNVVLTALIARKIWSIRQETNEFLGRDKSHGRLTGLVKTALESGMLYPLIVAVCLAIQISGTHADLHPLLTIIAGLAPTFIMVQAGLGLSVENKLKPFYLNKADELPSYFLTVRPVSMFNGDTFVTNTFEKMADLKSLSGDGPLRPPSVYAGNARFSQQKVPGRNVRFVERNSCVDCDRPR